MVTVIINIKDIIKNYVLPFETSLEDIKKIIIKDFEISFSFNLDNISRRNYRNFGKMFMGSGVIQSSYNNKVLANFFNEGQSVELSIIEISEEELKTSSSLDNLMEKVKVINNPKKEFTLDINDFPPLS